MVHRCGICRREITPWGSIGGICVKCYLERRSRDMENRYAVFVEFGTQMHANCRTRWLPLENMNIHKVDPEEWRLGLVKKAWKRKLDRARAGKLPWVESVEEASLYGLTPQELEDNHR